MTTYDVTANGFRDLKNPYTGEPMRVKMLVGAGEPKFFCPDTYSTAERFKDGRTMYNMWCRTDGVLATKVGEPIRCAYTGEFLVPAEDAGGHYFTGGFDPRIPRTKQQFLHFAWMRNGESPYPETADAARVDPVAEKPAPKSSKTIEANSVSEELAAGVMARARVDLPKKTVVKGASFRKAKK